MKRSVPAGFMPRNVTRQPPAVGGRSAGRGVGSAGGGGASGAEPEAMEASTTSAASPEASPPSSVGQRCRDLDEFEQLEQLGKGEFGVVRRAKDKSNPTGPALCLKELTFDFNKEGFPLEVELLFLLFFF